MITQTKLYVSLGAGIDGIEVGRWYEEAAKKAGHKNASKWARAVLDKEAEKTLGKKPKISS